MGNCQLVIHVGILPSKVGEDHLRFEYQSYNPRRYLTGGRVAIRPYWLEVKFLGTGSMMYLRTSSARARVGVPLLPISAITNACPNVWSCGGTSFLLAAIGYPFRRFTGPPTAMAPRRLY